MQSRVIVPWPDEAREPAGAIRPEHEPARESLAVKRSNHGGVRRRLGLRQRRRLVRAPIDPPREAAASGHLAGVMVEPGEPMGRQFDGDHLGAIGRWNLRKPPRAAVRPLLQQQVVMEPRGIVGGAGVFQEREAWHASGAYPILEPAHEGRRPTTPRPPPSDPISPPRAV